MRSLGCSKKPAVLGLLNLLHKPFLRSDFYKSLKEKAGKHYYAHKDKRGKFAAWSTGIGDGRHLGPQIIWRIKFNDTRFGEWVLRVDDTGVVELQWRSAESSKPYDEHPPLFEQEVFNELFDTLRAAIKAYVSNHKLCVRADYMLRYRF